jgi:hypothetical protein
MTQPTDKQSKSPGAPRPEPANPKTPDPERDRYGSRGQHADAAGRKRRELPKDDEYGDFLRDDEPPEAPTERDK